MQAEAAPPPEVPFWPSGECQPEFSSMAPSVPFPAQCSVRREIPFSPVCSKSPAVEHPQQSHWSPALSDMAGLDEMGRQQLQLALKLPCSFFTSQASGGGPLTPCGIGGRGWRGAEHSPGILPTNSCFSLKKKNKFLLPQARDGTSPSRGGGASWGRQGSFWKDRGCVLFSGWVHPSQPTPRNSFPLCPTWLFQQTTVWGSWSFFFFFCPETMLLRTKIRWLIKI